MIWPGTILSLFYTNFGGYIQWGFCFSGIQNTEVSSQNPGARIQNAGVRIDQLSARVRTADGQHSKFNRSTNIRS